jgi:hypothetical protein
VGAFTVGAAGSSELPAAVAGPTVLAGTATGAFGMVVCILVEGNRIEGMEVAKYVAASSTVMPSCKVSEVSGASCFVTNRRIRIRLQGRGY